VFVADLANYEGRCYRFEYERQAEYRTAPLDSKIEWEYYRDSRYAWVVESHRQIPDMAAAAAAVAAAVVVERKTLMCLVVYNSHQRPQFVAAGEMKMLVLFVLIPNAIHRSLKERLSFFH